MGVNCRGFLFASSYVLICPIPVLASFRGASLTVGAALRLLDGVCWAAMALLVTDELGVEFDLSTKAGRELWCEAEIGPRLAAQIKAVRISRGLTQEELARAAGVKVATVRKYERPSSEGKSVSMLQRFARVFDCALIISFQSWSVVIASAGCWIVPEPFMGE